MYIYAWDPWADVKLTCTEEECFLFWYILDYTAGIMRERVGQRMGGGETTKERAGAGECARA